MMRTAIGFAVTSCCAWFLGACGNGEYSGGYDDVANPAIQVALKDSTGGNAREGTLDLFARYQNPWHDSLPILTVSTLDGSITVEDTAVQSAFVRAQARGIPVPGKDTLEFNFLATAPGREAFLGGFALIRRQSRWEFIRQTNGRFAYPDAKQILRTEARMPSPVFGQRGRIGARGLELGLKRFFVPGSPYKSALEAGDSFALARLAAGRYEIKAISADEKVYTAVDSLETGAEYDASDWFEAEVVWVAP